MNELLVIGNPSKRKRHRRKAKAKRSHARRRHTKRARKSFRVRARRNPIPFVGGLMPTIKGGAIGAVGGIANDLLYGFAASKLAFLPQSGLGRSAAKVLTSLVVGKVGNMALRGKGGDLAKGAATVAIHAALKEQMATVPFLANLNLGEYIEEPAQLMHGYDPGMPVDGFEDESEFLNGDDDEGMGEYIEQ